MGHIAIAGSQIPQLLCHESEARSRTPSAPRYAQCMDEPAIPNCRHDAGRRCCTRVEVSRPPKTRAPKLQRAAQASLPRHAAAGNAKITLA